MRLPLPFTITIHGIGYDTSDLHLRGVFDSSQKLEAALIEVLESHTIPDVEIDVEVEFHEYQFREEWMDENPVV